MLLPLECNATNNPCLKATGEPEWRLSAWRYGQKAAFRPGLRKCVLCASQFLIWSTPLQPGSSFKSFLILNKLGGFLVPAPWSYPKTTLRVLGSGQPIAKTTRTTDLTFLATFKTLAPCFPSKKPLLYSRAKCNALQGLRFFFSF